MYDKLIKFYYDYFMDEKNDGWRLIGSSVCVGILSGLYENFISKNEVPPMEDLPIEQKQKYWDVACKYFTDLPDRIKASKASYVLSLITSTF